MRTRGGAGRAAAGRAVRPGHAGDDWSARAPPVQRLSGCLYVFMCACVSTTILL